MFSTAMMSGMTVWHMGLGTRVKTNANPDTVAHSWEPIIEAHNTPKFRKRSLIAREKSSELP